MKTFRRTDFVALGFSLLMLIGGLKIFITGEVRGGLFLGDERYLVGGVLFFFGLYVLVLSLRNKGG